MSIEAMKLALEALENSKPSDAGGMLDAEAMNELWHAHYAAINALRAALSQQPATDEPVAWGAFYFGGRLNGKLYTTCETKDQIERYIADRHQSDDSNTFRAAPLYTHPARSVPDGLLRRFALALEVVDDGWRASDPTLRIDVAAMLAAKETQ